MPARNEAYHDSPLARARLVAFLERSFRGQGGCSQEQWQRRLSHWWEDNPFARNEPRRGWVLCDGDVVHGFLGVIPWQYDAADGTPVPALVATSWAVDESHRHAALGMAFQFQRLSRKHLLVDTTPSPPVQAMLRHQGWTERREVRRTFLLRALAARVMQEDLNLPAFLRFTQDPTDVTAVARGADGRLQKAVTPEYLSWYVRSPMRDHRFLGVVDSTGLLSSYVIATPERVRGVPAWSVVDWFSARAEQVELRALVAALCRHPKGWPGRRWPLLVLTSFPPADCWRDLPRVAARRAEVCHFYSLPAHLRDQPQRPVLAEGDWGL